MEARKSNPINENEIVKYSVEAIGNIGHDADICTSVTNYIGQNITDTQMKEHPTLCKNIVLSLMDAYPEYRQALIPLAIKYDPCITTDMTSFDAFIKNSDDRDSYFCHVFPKSVKSPLVLTPGTIMLVGARVSRGKSTACCSVCLDALMSGKKVIYVSTEESVNQVQLRLAVAILFRLGHYENIDSMIHGNKWRDMLRKADFNPRRVVKKVLRGEAIEDIFGNGENTKAFIHGVHMAYELLDKYMRDGSLAIYNDMAGSSFEDMIDVMTLGGHGTVAIMDYIQRVRPPAKVSHTDNRFVVMKEACEQIAVATKKSDIITICAAQFGCTGEKKDSTVMDTFTDESFQECSAIEQVGEIEIGIGRQYMGDGTKHSFYSILKDRDNGEFDPSKCFELDGLEKFSLFEPLYETDRDGRTILSEYRGGTSTLRAGVTASNSRKKDGNVRNVANGDDYADGGVNFV